MSFKPTPEQDSIITAFKTGGNLVIEAGAGTGKTSTLKLIAEAAGDAKGVYIAYNRAIADDAKKSFPSNVECATAHSFAYRAIGNQFRSRLNVKIGPSQAARNLGIRRGFIGNDGLALSPAKVYRLVEDTLTRFCYDSTTKPLLRHVPPVDGLDEDHNFKLAKLVMEFVPDAWADAQNPRGSKINLKNKHDYYLKMWALTNPRLNVKFVMLDEAQDANPVIAQIVNAQPCQKIMVGDRSQAIYAWRGAVDAMTNFPADHRLMLSQSFRFGPAVADEANKWLDLLDAPLRLSGFDKIASRLAPVEHADAVLCRTNAEAIRIALEAQAKGKQVAIVGGTREIKRFAEAARDLMGGRDVWHEDLSPFKNWQQVLDHVQEDDKSDIKVMVKLIETYGVNTVIQVCDNSVSEAKADLIVSTAHKSKGREWDHVRIADDFRPPADDPETGEQGKLSKGELCLAYVAVTRAKRTLDRGSLSWIDTYRAA